MPLGAPAPLKFPDVESWAEAYIGTEELSHKLEPPPIPDQFRRDPCARRVAAPGRPREFRQAKRGERTPRSVALKHPHYRARVLHAFFHHELQAAELMCWAVLAFPGSEREFRRGLLGICLDEIRHMNLYREHIESLGHRIGDFGVRDWFWKRVPACLDAREFVAVMGMGLEAANLEHAPDFAARFELAGDHAGAAIQRRIAAEEVAHVSFAVRWFRRWTGNSDFATWQRHLPPPLSPWVLRGEPIAEEARRKAGMSEEFLRELALFEPEPKGRPARQA
jgi:uncharacterized ferritin-like protein (DUF455 family)